MNEPEVNRPTCAATPGCRRTPTHGLICAAHLERMGAMLRDIEDEAAILSAVPSMQIRTGSGGGSLASERAPARLDVLVHTDRRRGTGRSETDDDAVAAGDTLPILDVLHAWARVVREERGFASRAQITISGERDVLSRQLEWVAAQPWVDECYRDISQLLGQLRAVNGTGQDKAIAHCYLVHDEEPCEGTIRRHDQWHTVWRISPDRCTRETVQVADGAAYCDRCFTTWQNADLVRLLLIVEQDRIEAARPRTSDGRRMLTVHELAAEMGKSVNAVRIIASREGITAVDGHYDPAAFVKESA